MIVLCMIAKDEATVIGRAIDSVRHLIDAWVIGDTGSTDATKCVIQDALQGVPGSLIDVPWTDDYAAARNAVREVGRGLFGDSCHMLSLDADEELHGALPEILGAEAYATNVITDEGREFPRVFLAKAHVPWRYPLHEVLDADQVVELHRPPMLNACHIRSHHDGVRARGGEATARKDIEILNKWIDREPDEPRAWFYLGQSHRTLHGFTNSPLDLREAKTAYLKRLSFELKSPEARFSALWVAYLDDLLGMSPLESLLAACEIGHPMA